MTIRLLLNGHVIRETFSHDECVSCSKIFFSLFLNSNRLWRAIGFYVKIKRVCSEILLNFEGYS